MQSARLVERVRRACLEAAREAYEDASLRGLCREGAWEVALDRIRSLDLAATLAPAEPRAAEATAPPRHDDTGSRLAALSAAHAAALLENVATRCGETRTGGHPRTRRIAARAAALRVALASETDTGPGDAVTPERILGAAENASRVAHFAAELDELDDLDGMGGAASGAALAVLRIAAAAALCLLDAAETGLPDSEVGEPARAARRRIWRARLLLRRAHHRADPRGPECF